MEPIGEGGPKKLFKFYLD
jgi:hypothetical protein